MIELIVHCHDCKWFDRFATGDLISGYCRIDPPIILPATSNKKGHFPIVNEKDWCGGGVLRTN